MIIEYMDPLFYLVGKLTVTLAAVIIVLSLFGALMILYSFKTGHFLAARLMLISVSVLESAIKAIFWFARADDAIVDDVGVRLRNYINRKKFLRVPYNERFIFMPQCVRSTECPAKLTPEGIRCISCGRCNIGKAKEIAEGLGYRFFIVPGSSFIKRIIKKYRPGAIIGVGCQMEIKEGLILCHSHDIPAIGVMLSQAGCVSTTLDWNKFYDIISDKIQS
ncbi:MAG: DUF116 domain-containing protein [Methanotrichaceae archaeon]